ASASPAAGLAGQPSIAASASPFSPSAPAAGVQRAAETPASGSLMRAFSLGPPAPKKAPRAADIPQQPAASAPGAAVQRSPEAPAAAKPAAPPVGERPLGLGAPFRPTEAPGGAGVQRSEVAPSAPGAVPTSSLPPTF